MTLVRQIQEDAVSDSASVSSLLRKCMLLAGRLDNEELRAWAEQELNGYDDESPLPPYRPRLETQVRGTLSGPMQSEIRGQALARASVPEDWREGLFSVEIRMGVAAIESFCDGEASEVYSPWPMEAVAYTQSQHIEGYNLMSAQRVIPVAALIGVLDGIRTRVLQFATDIERENPEAGEEVGPDQIPPERLTQIVLNNFYGDNAAVATGGRDVHQSQTVLSAKLEIIEATLDGLGIGRDDIRELTEALRKEGMPGGALGPKTRHWLDRLEAGAIKLGAGVTTAAATQLILSVLGLT